MKYFKNPQETENFGKKISKKYKKLLLYGELGSGKTTFVKGFCDGLGIDKNIVQSPTYTYINIYDNKLLHIDLYRINNFEEIFKKGIGEEIDNFEYVIIERPKFEKELYIDNFTKLNFEIFNNGRKINISKD